jgi:hypothetical protein
MIFAILRRQLDRGLALVDGIIPSLFLVVDTAQQIVRLSICRLCREGQVQARNCIVCPACRQVGRYRIQLIVGNRSGISCPRLPHAQQGEQYGRER